MVQNVCSFRHVNVLKPMFQNDTTSIEYCGHLNWPRGLQSTWYAIWAGELGAIFVNVVTSRVLR